jgi:hypothetical protein
MSHRDAIHTADAMETGLNLLALGVMIAGQRVADDAHLRHEILAHNAGVARARAARVAKRQADDALGRALLLEWAADRRRLQ